MNTAAAFTIPEVVPCARPRAALAVNPRTRELLLKNGKPFVHVYQDANTRRFEASVTRIAEAAIGQPLANYWSATVTVFTRDRRVIDLDNIVKAVIDGVAASGRVPGDHRLWCYSRIERRLTDRAERIEVELAEMEPAREGTLV